jgi:hypothetical protein
MGRYASPLGLSPHERRSNEGFVRVDRQCSGVIPRGSSLLWNGATALARVSR